MSKDCEYCATQATIDGVEIKFNNLVEEIARLKIGLRRFRDREAARLQIPAIDFIDFE